MRKSMFLTLLVLASGCTTVPDDAAKLGIQFQFTEANRCSTISPRIAVTGTPEVAAKYSVRLRDQQAPSYNHGGGTVPVSNGIIPAGALKDYRGPCPPSGQHTYVFTVNALDASGAIVGVGTATQRF